MPCAFLYQNLASGAVVTSAAATVDTMPLSNLAEPQPRRRVRLMGGTVALVLDFGVAVGLDCAALISTSLGSGASVRCRLSSLDSTGAAGDGWDTGLASAATNADCGGNVVFTRPSIASGRYLRIDITDATAQFHDVGLLVAGALWRPVTGMAYGMREGRALLDRRDRNSFTGAEFAVPALSKPRMVSFSLSALTSAEVQGHHRALVERLGAVGDALCILDTSDTRAEINRRSVWGAINAPGEDAGVERVNFSWSQRSFRMVERV